MGNVGFENLKELALALRDTYGLTTFIETGTYKAATTAWATDNFKRVVSIELDESWHNRAKRKIFAKQKNVKLVLGDSGKELSKVLKRLKQPALIWLDAHWCKASKATRPECPLREELAAIRDSGVEHFILIDDARLFENPPNSDWPGMKELIKLLPDGYSYVTWNDAIISVPAKAFKTARKFTTSPSEEVKVTTLPEPVVPKKGPPLEESKLEPVILTSNLYLHCLPPFAYLFNKFWANQPAKVVRYEVRPPKLPPNFTNYAIGRQEDYTWSSGLLKYLDDHQGELILLMLEDYFINGAVHKNVIGWAWKFMLGHPEVAKIDLSDDRMKVPHTNYWTGENSEMIESAPDSPFQTSLQAAIWRVDFLRRFLDRNENPWQFEKQGTKRVIAAREAGEFDGLILGFKNPPLTYVNAVGGEGSQPKLWDDKKIPPWMVQELSRKGLM